MIDIPSTKQKILEVLTPLNPEKIILFGSYAYGNPNEESDLDICIVEKHVDSKSSEVIKIRKLLGKLGFAIDIVVSSLAEFDFYKEEINSIFYDIDKKGVKLWQSS